MRRLAVVARCGVIVGLLQLISACALPPSETDAESAPRLSEIPVDETAMLPLLGYFQLIQGMSPAELSRQRQILAVSAPTPSVQLRQAMLYGLPRPGADLARALSLVDGVLRSRDPSAISLQPLAGLLAAYYLEQRKLETQNDKLAQQVRETQKRNEELQSKLDALANIERSIPVRPGYRKPPSGTRQ